jgi:hypothetical protein
LSLGVITGTVGDNAAKSGLACATTPREGYALRMSTLRVLLLLLSSLTVACFSRVPPPPQPRDAPDFSIVCDDENACTIDADVDDACVHTPEPDGAPCDDGNACTVADTCQQQRCASGAGGGSLAFSPGVVVADTSQFPQIWDRRGDIVLWSVELDTPPASGPQTAEPAIIPRAFVRTNTATGVSVPVVDNGFFDTTFKAVLDDAGNMWGFSVIDSALWRIGVDQAAVLVTHIDYRSFGLAVHVHAGLRPVVDVAWYSLNLGEVAAISALRIDGELNVTSYREPWSLSGSIGPAVSIHVDNTDAFRASLINNGVIDVFTFQPSGEIEVVTTTSPLLEGTETFSTRVAPMPLSPRGAPIHGLLETTSSGDVLVAQSNSLVLATSPLNTRVLDSVRGSINHLDDVGVVVVRRSSEPDATLEIVVHDFVCAENGTRTRRACAGNECALDEVCVTACGAGLCTPLSRGCDVAGLPATIALDGACASSVAIVDGAPTCVNDACVAVGGACE